MNMADGRASYPSVFMVEKGINLPPPLPPKPGERRKQKQKKQLIQNAILVLVCLALAGLLVEGYFIYDLRKANRTNAANKTAEANPRTDAQKGEPPIIKKRKQLTVLPPSKPLAHLAGGVKKPPNDGIMKWNENGDSTVYKFTYNEGKLTVEQEGYYYVYSKLSYSADGSSFIQMVKRETKRYMGDPIELLTYRRHNSNTFLKGTLRNSYVGGVFHLYKEDSIFVHVNNGSLVRLHSSADNFFGMFML